MWRLAVSVVLAFGLTAASAEEATEWRVDREESRIVFEYLADGEPTEGVFTKFSGTGTFDPAAPSAATLELRIESASIDLSDSRANAFATSAEWFDSANHPHIVYRLLDLAPLKDDHYRAEGELTIKGRTRPVATTIELVIEDSEARASGTLRINRKDYWLGVGPISLFVEIGAEVAVRFELVAHPAR